MNLTPFNPTQLMSDMRAILRNLRQWPTAAEPQGDFQAYVREQVRTCMASNGNGMGGSAHGWAVGNVETRQ